MRTVHIVALGSNGVKMIVNDSQIKNNRVEVSSYDEHDERVTNWELVSIEKTFFIYITAQFVMNTTDNSPYTMSRGFRDINGLGYTYAVSILEKPYRDLYECNLVYTKSGVRCTNFDMYSYHRMVDNKAVYEDTSRLEYEVFTSLDLYKILELERPE